MMIINSFHTNFKGIIDTTLREGLQFVRSDFSAREAQQIAHHLDRIGVEYIELGNPINPHLRAMIESVLKLTLERSKLLCHIRNRSSDLDAAISLDISGVNLLCTADERRIVRMGLTIDEYMEELRINVQKAKHTGLEVRVSIEDYFNQSSEMSSHIIRFANMLSVDRIGVADTLGNTPNWKVYEQIQILRSLTDIDIEVHMHNDLGNAVSNAVWAVMAGANWVDTTLLGIGERTGITPLSSFLVNVHALAAKRASAYKLSLLTTAEYYLASVCTMDTPFNLITNQENAFAHKAGIHLDAIKKLGTSVYEAIPAELVGNHRVFVTDSQISGKAINATVAA